MKVLGLVACILLVVGGLNWGLVGLFQFDLVAAIFGGVDAMLARLVYVVVGVSAVLVAMMIPKIAAPRAV